MTANKREFEKYLDMLVYPSSPGKIAEDIEMLGANEYFIEKIRELPDKVYRSASEVIDVLDTRQKEDEDVEEFVEGYFHGFSRN